MNTKKIIKYILIAIPLLYLAQCGYYKFESTKSPEINPNPKEKMRIYGKFPFEKDLKLDIGLLYLTTNPKCDEGIFSAGPRFGQRFMKLFPATVKDGKFESDIYLDYYRSGMCEWRAYGVFALMRSQKKIIQNGIQIVINEDEVPTEHYPLGLLGGSVVIDEKQTNDDLHAVNANNQIGVISYEPIKKQSEPLKVECTQRTVVFYKGLPQEVNFTRLDCNYIGEISRPIPDSGSEPKANISSSQKEVQFNFIDKGWKAWQQ